MRICKPNETGLIFGQGSPSMMNWSGFVMPAPTLTSVTVIDAFGGVGSGGSAHTNTATSNSLFDSGVTNGVRDDGRSLGYGCGTATNDHLVPDVVFGVSVTEACRAHDTAYSTCGVSKAQADQQFSVDIAQTCKEQGASTALCSTLSGAYGLAVGIFGGGAYDAAQAASGCTNNGNSNSTGGGLNGLSGDTATSGGALGSGTYGGGYDSLGGLSGEW